MRLLSTWYEGVRTPTSRVRRRLEALRECHHSVWVLSPLRSTRRRSLPEEARKLLSFTDNRQDAALQAGHFNDFVQVNLLAGRYVTLQAKVVPSCCVTPWCTTYKAVYEGCAHPLMSPSTLGPFTVHDATAWADFLTGALFWSGECVRLDSVTGHDFSAEPLYQSEEDLADMAVFYGCPESEQPVASPPDEITLSFFDFDRSGTG